MKLIIFVILPHYYRKVNIIPPIFFKTFPINSTTHNAKNAIHAVISTKIVENSEHFP